MAIITIDMRIGRTDEQKRLFASAIIALVGRAISAPASAVYLVMREHPGINFVVEGKHLQGVGKPAHSD